MGVERFRVGGSSGGWVALLGNWAELDEDVIPLEAWACPGCRRVELRLPQER
jgi:hypothetical protein